MPSIDSSRLERQVDELKDLVSDPTALRRQVMDMFDYYADRTRRPNSRGKGDDGPWVYGVPGPVYRSLSRALEAELRSHPEWTVPAAEALWQAGYRETQYLAASIMGGLGEETVPMMVEAFALAGRDPIATETLADKGLRKWRKVDPLAFRSWAGDLVRSDRSRLKSLGFLSLLAAVRDPEFEYLPETFRLLSGQMGEVRGEARRSLRSLLSGLAIRSPRETTAFLENEIERGTAGAGRMTRNIMKHMPPRQQDTLKTALAG